MFYEFLILILIVFIYSCLYLALDTIAKKDISFFKKVLLVTISVVFLLAAEIYILYIALMFIFEVNKMFAI